MVLFMFAVLLVASIGYLAQTTGLCMVRGVDEAASGNPLFLLAILLSGAFAWTSLLLAYFYGTAVPFASHGPGMSSILGGLLFGVGAAFNNGCGVSTISKLARGQLAMLATIIGWLVGWLLEAAFFPEVQLSVLEIPAQLNFGVLVLMSAIVLVFITRMEFQNRKTWMSMMAIGFMAGVVFLYEPKWTPSGLLKDVSLSIWAGEESLWPSIERFTLAAALVAGMISAALRSHSFHLQLTSVQTFLRHLVAGIAMGLGAAIAGGGNDSQLLIALPSLSPAGLVAVLSIIVGIYSVGRIRGSKA